MVWRVREVLASRWLRVAALLWVVGFFVVFVPAHRRGMVGLPHAAAAVEAQAERLVSGAVWCPLCSPAKDRGGSAPAPAPGGCAVCHLKAGLDLPTPVVLAPRFVAEIEFLIHRPEPGFSLLLASQRSHRGRAPPAA